MTHLDNLLPPHQNLGSQKDQVMVLVSHDWQFIFKVNDESLIRDPQVITCALKHGGFENIDSLLSIPVIFENACFLLDKRSCFAL